MKNIDMLFPFEAFVVKKLKVGNDQEKKQSEIPTPKIEFGKKLN